MSQPVLSLCMIVKDEEETLERCLAAARPFVDEIVVVDTGSTDATPEIARRYADVYEEIEWPDSFSIARNHSFDLASGKYILVLDGDEYLPDPDHWALVRRVTEYDGVASVQLRVRNLLAPGQLMAADRFWQDRIFLNTPRIRYAGRVHNQIEDGLNAHMAETGDVRLREPAEIIHTGYSHESARMKSKYAVRVDLLRREYEEAAEPHYRAYFGYQLAVFFFVLERFEEAAEVFGEIDYSVLSPDNAFYAHLLASQTALKQGESVVALLHCNEMLTIYRHEPIAYYSTGLALLGTRQVGDGMLMLLEAYKLNDEAGPETRFVLNAGVLLENLALICRKTGLPDHAAAFTALSSRSEPSVATIKALIGSMQLGIVQAEAESTA